MADKNCGDFHYQEDAQAAHQQHPEWGLDSPNDADNIACESLPSRPVTTQPVPGQAGELPLTGPSPHGTATATVGSAALLIGAGLVFFTRYRAKHTR